MHAPFSASSLEVWLRFCLATIGVAFFGAANAAAAGFGCGYLGGSGIRTTKAFQGAGSLFTQKLTANMVPTVLKTATVFAGTSFLSAFGLRSYDHMNR